LTDGTLLPYTYQNAATIGLILKEFEWVEGFIHRYHEALLPEHREGLFHFNLARLAYQRNQLDQALVMLQKAEYKDVMLNLAAKTLQLKIYYELDEFDLLESHLQAFRAFLNRRKDIGYHRENYLNLVVFTQKLLEIGDFNKKEGVILRSQIVETKAVAERDWLLECLKF
jgi:tetratricopeptide (TPR) repeat protein